MQPLIPASSKGKTKICVFDTKECWKDPNGKWISSGGFPLQVAGIASLFDRLSLVIQEVPPKGGGLALPAHAEVFPLRTPQGSGHRRKASVIAQFPYYFGQIFHRCQEADAVYVSPPGDFQFLGMVVALLCGKPLIVRYCGSWHTTSRMTAANRITQWVMRLSGGDRNVMFATGSGSEPPGRRVEWIFSSALSESELAGLNPVLERGLSEPPRLAYAGRLSIEKGVANLITAIARLKAEHFQPVPTVAIAGDGPDRPRLEQLVRDLGCQNEVRFVGQLNRSELASHFSQGDFAVQPSLSEGYCKAWLDAMAHGLPVLASEVGAADAVIGRKGERGWLVPPGDVPALTRKLKQVLGEKLDWPVLRRRCSAFVQAQTLEAWTRTIGERCAQRWGMQLVEGKLR